MRLINPLGGAGCLAEPFARRCALTAAALLALGVATPAVADTANSSVSYLAPIEIRVASNGSEYTDIAEYAGPITGQIKVEVDAQISGKVKFWKVWPLIRQVQGTWIKFENFGSSQTYAIAQRPKKVNKSVPFMIPHTLYKIHVVAACNIQAAALRSQGWSNWKIFANDRTLKLAVSEGMAWETSGISGTVPPPEVGGNYPEITVVCERDPNAPTAEDLEPDLHPIENVSLEAKVIKSPIGECSLRLIGSITARETGRDIEFRYVGDGGEQSPVQTVFVPAGQPTVEFEHTFPMNFNEKKDRWIKMIGIDPPFDSDSAQYESCDAPLTDEAAVLPPKAKSMGFEVAEEIMRNGLACPSVITVEGTVEGRGGRASGSIMFRADGERIHMTPYSLNGVELKQYKAQYALSWQDIQSSKQSVNFGIHLFNSQRAEVDTLEGTKHFECYEPLPPKSVSLDMVVVQEAKRDGMLCPAEIEVRSILKGGGGVFSGTASFTANAEESAPQPISIAGQSILIAKETLPVSWQGVTGTEQDVALSVSIRDADGGYVTMRPGAAVLQCREGSPELGPLWMITSPEEVMHNGMACPASVEVTTDVVSRGLAFSGTALVRANANQIGAVPVAIEAEGPESSQFLKVPYPISWAGVDSSSQAVQFAVSLRDANGDEVTSTWKAQEVECREVSTVSQALGGAHSEGAASGPGTADPASRGRLAVGEIAAAPSTGQTTRDRIVGGRTQVPAVGQVAVAPVAFTILSPKGRLRPGPRAEIRLSGAVPEGGYTLRFYRKDKGRYKLVRLAGLPQSMDGNRQLLRTNALRSAADWRVEVCPADASRQACKTSDFTLARGGGSGDKEPEIMVITPGAINTN